MDGIKCAVLICSLLCPNSSYQTYFSRANEKRKKNTICGTSMFYNIDG